MSDEPPSAEVSTSWPYASLLLFGFFGGEEGRAAAARGGIGLIVLIMGLILMTSDAGATAYVTGSMMTIGAIAFMLGSTAVYIRGLDELSRLIQLEAAAWTYGLVFLLFFVLMVVAGGPPTATVNPGLIILAEPIRGLALVFVARRYR